ncbi:hypothetical protein [Paenibacillus periandrae]|uniref:hypothetical protein n=1 Tax=Paenibacillus periandrae TaxID=1761741 RepID=UPI001F08D6F4|nr:hypothetical protein [Paenibacillus periandrae]
METVISTCSGYTRYLNLLSPTKLSTKVVLTVVTRRGIERAIPAYPELDLTSKANSSGEVDRVYTFQGQRELIHEYGVKFASDIVSAKGIHLHILQKELNETGNLDKIRIYLEEKQKKQKSKGLYWMSESPIEVWT